MVGYRDITGTIREGIAWGEGIRILYALRGRKRNARVLSGEVPTADIRGKAFVERVKEKIGQRAKVE